MTDGRGDGVRKGDGAQMVVWADRCSGREREVDFRVSLWDGFCRGSKKRSENGGGVEERRRARSRRLEGAARGLENEK